MNQWKRQALVSALILSEVLVPISLPRLSFAQTAPPPAIGVSSGIASASGFDSVRPPEMQGIKTLQMANIFSSCMNLTVPLMATAGAAQGIAMAFANRSQGVSMMGGAACSAMSAGVSATTVCPGGDAAGGMTSMGMGMGMGGGMNCTMVGTPAMMQMEAMLDLAICGNMCKAAKELAEQQELKCISQQATVLQQGAGSLMSVLTAGMQRMQADVAIIKAQVEHRQAQQFEVQRKLLGDPANGSKGLIAQQKETQQKLTEMSSQISQLETQQQSVVRNQKALDQQVKTLTTGYARDCLEKTTVSNYRCVQNGPPVSATEYLLCRYKQEQSLGANRVIERNKLVTARATSATQGLESVINAMISDMPTRDSAAIPVDQKELMASAKQGPAVILSLEDAMNRYGGRLGSFQVGNVSARDFIQRELSRCYQAAQKPMSEEVNREDRSIGKARFELQQARQANASMARQLLDDASQVYSANMTSLAGQGVPPNTAGCLDRTPEIALGCVKNLRVALNNQLMGTGMDQFKMSGKFSGTQTSQGIPYTCRGLNGCIATMQSLDQKLTNETKRLTTYKSQYVLNANQNVDTFAKNIASQLSVQNQMLAQRLKLMGIVLPPVPGEQLQKDADGLYQTPKNALNFIGQFANPPLLDPNSSALASAIKDSESQAQQASSNLARLQVQRAQLSALGPSCKAQAAGAALDSSLSGAEYQASDLADANCGQVLPDCAARQNDLSRIMTELRGNASVTSYSTFHSLNSGISQVCNSSSTGQSSSRTLTAQQCQMAFNSLKGSLQSAAVNAKTAGSAGSANMGGGMYPGGMYPGGGMMPGGMYPGGGMYPSGGYIPR